MQLSLHYVAALIVALMLAVSGGVILISAAAHSSNLPVCWHCGANKVRRSATHCILDTAGQVLFLVPYRCRGCRVRFYGFRTRNLGQPYT
jgi:hypothetical protein